MTLDDKNHDDKEYVICENVYWTYIQIFDLQSHL